MKFVEEKVISPSYSSAIFWILVKLIAFNWICKRISFRVSTGKKNVHCNQFSLVL